ncbi:hypothetical protein SEVIR_6G053601v4 [Setaria viridis]
MMPRTKTKRNLPRLLSARMAWCWVWFGKVRRGIGGRRWRWTQEQDIHGRMGFMAPSMGWCMRWVIGWKGWASHVCGRAARPRARLRGGKKTACGTGTYVYELALAGREIVLHLYHACSIMQKTFFFIFASSPLQIKSRLRCFFPPQNTIIDIFLYCRKC